MSNPISSSGRAQPLLAPQQPPRALKPMKARSAAECEQLEQLPNIGPSLANDLRRTRHGIELIPENPDFQTIVVAPDDESFELEGIAVGLIRNTMLM